jgi:hypothetical protein
VGVTYYFGAELAECNETLSVLRELHNTSLHLEAGVLKDICGRSQENL